jgi:hypothetical protein
MPIKKRQIENAPDILSSSSKPTTGSGKGSFFTKAVLGITEGFYVDSNEIETQITSNGTILGGGGGGSSSLVVKNQGTTLTSAATTLNFTGSAVTSSLTAPGVVEVNIVGGSGLTLGELSTTAYRGDRGAIAYTHSQVAHAPSTAEANSGVNLGSISDGEAIFTSKSGLNLQFKRIKAGGTGISITSEANDLLITNTGAGTGEANTASHATLGTGTGLIWKEKSGVDLVFRKLLAGTNVSITTGTNDVTINATGGGTGDSLVKRTVSFSNPTNVKVFLYGMGTQADMNNVVITKNTGSDDITISSVPSGLKLTSICMNHQTMNLSSGVIYLIYPDPNGASSFSDASLPVISKFTTAGAFITTFTGNSVVMDTTNIKIGFTVGSGQFTQAAGGIAKVVI